MTWSIAEQDKIANAWMLHRRVGSECKMFLEECPAKHDLVTLARQRDSFRQGTSHNRELAGNYEYIGLMGEWAFHLRFGYPIDMAQKPEGDDGIDFATPLGSVDVKTATELYGLFVEADKAAYADIFVLTRYRREDDEARMVGWCFAKDILAEKPQCSRRGVFNHYLSVKELRKIGEMESRLSDVIAREGDYPVKSRAVAAPQRPFRARVIPNVPGTTAASKEQRLARQARAEASQGAFELR